MKARTKMAKEKKGKKAEDRRKKAADSSPPEAWLGQAVRVRHPVNLRGSLAVGSSVGRLEDVGDRGVVLLVEDELSFYPWSSVIVISPGETSENPV